MSTGQVWRTFTLGVTMWSRALSKVRRVVVQSLVKFRQFADVLTRGPYVKRSTSRRLCKF